jgi:OHCU decarboxylase
MNERRWTLAELNAMDRDTFTRVIGPVFEHSPWIADAAWNSRPFESIDLLHHTLCKIMAQSGQPKQLALIQAHPDLVANMATAGSLALTPASVHEQSSAGLDRLNASEIEAFQKYNQQYRERFGFPFVICARLNKKESILNAFPIRLQNDRDTEIQGALDEIAKIARLRLDDLVTL